MRDRRVRELILISVLAAFCGGLAWTQPLFSGAQPASPLQPARSRWTPWTQTV
jgi:hypothetical protein